MTPRTVIQTKVARWDHYGVPKVGELWFYEKDKVLLIAGVANSEDCSDIIALEKMEQDIYVTQAVAVICQYQQ